MNLFGKAKKAPPPKETLENLQQTKANLEKREEYLQAKIAAELANAKKYASTNKRMALTALKRKKMYETQAAQLAGMQMNLEQQIITIEGASANMDALKAMKQGGKQLRKMQDSMTVEDIDNTMVEIQEGMDVANEIGEALSQSIGAQFDETDLLDELELLEQEQLDSQLLGVQNVPTSALPNVPTGAPKTKVDEDEAELAALQAAMA
eukprot:comp24800_c0_seq1/m.46888 comp24800_c0_seq1/g.46888  ORF comp24800_c0_seq1/g.46888 comp24800_c0_seq1/m.46888 type:complete len:208 (-) comp24800_c0_seq1:362-985(-)